MGIKFIHAVATDIKTYFFSILTQIQDQQILKDVSGH